MISPTVDRVFSNFNVTFDGRLQVDGVPAATAAGATFPLGGTGPRDASQFFGLDGVAVDLFSTYTGTMVAQVATGGSGPTYGTDRAWFTTYSNFNNLVRSIDVNQAGEIAIDPLNSEAEYEYSLRSVDPTNIINGNSVALAGRFALIDDEMAMIQFGKLSGSATLVNPAYTPYPADSGAVNTGIRSPYGLQFQVISEVTTQLDENGLITPKVVVRDGIEMNGSRVTGLGDGVDAGDAVNKGQLDAAFAAAGGRDPYVVVNGFGPTPVAEGSGAIAIGRLANGEGTASVSVGDYSSASSELAVAIGASTVASANGAVAVGYGSLAQGSSSVALGTSTKAEGELSIAIGQGAYGYGRSSVAIGSSTDGSRDGANAGDFATSIGAYARASNLSVAVGSNSLA